MKNPKINPLTLTEEQRTALENYEAQQKQLTILQDIADMTQDMLMEGDKEKKSTQKAVDDMGALLMDIRESLKSLNSKETPESPDFAKPVVEAVAKLEKALGKIEVKPSVTVSAPHVNVPKLDLTEFNKVLKTEMPKAFDAAIKGLKIPEVPKTDNSELLKAWEGISEQLVSIEHATRLKPQMPTTLKVTNVDGSAIGGSSSPEYIKLAGSDANERDSTYYGDGLTSGVMAVHERYFDGAAYNRTSATKTEVDKSTTTDVIYIGKAPIGTATSTAGWQIKKVDKTVTDNVTITFAAAGAFTATWNNRGSETYS
jgi:hypothetical protein